jgi:copper resistance protein D
MAKLLQIYGFLSVLLRGATLSFQSLVIGGIVFQVFIAGRMRERSQATERAILQWIRRWALALALTEAAILAAGSSLLMQSTGMTLGEVSGAMFFVATSLSMVAALSIAALAGPRANGKYADLLLPAAVILAGSVMTSHAMSRMEYRAALVVVTALHQGATAVWLGGLPYLLIALKRAPDAEQTGELGAKFSRMALVSVGVLATAGLVLGIAYVGSIGAVYGTSYGIMVTTKAILFGCLLLLGAMNYRLVRGALSKMAESLRSFGEAEIGIGISVILTAASLTSLPPAVDLPEGRVSPAAIEGRMAPRPPRLSSPTTRDLPEDVYAAQQAALETATGSAHSYLPGQAGMRPNTPAEKAWSEYNHHWAGLIVVAIGLLALLAQFGRLPGAQQRSLWARNWPLIFFGLSFFLIVRSDPETWPLGPGGFWVGMLDPEVLLHRIFALLVVGLGIFEWRVQTGRAKSARTALVFPILVAVASALLLTHSHALGNPQDEVLTELSHAPLAILGIAAAWSRWLELRLPAENQTRVALARVWPVCFLLIGALLLNYREM